MPKLIREGRMGPPLSYKTGAVVGTYPRPLLHLGGDPHGLDIIPNTPQPQSTFKCEVLQKDIVRIQHSEVEAYCNKKREELPPITHLNFWDSALAMNELYQPQPDSVNYPAFNRTGNLLIKRCPWKTVVVDPLTALTTIIFGHLAANQPGQLTDPRKWASSIGMKVMQTASSFCRINAHVVFIMHYETDKDETTSKVSTQPMMYSKNREVFSGIFAQFFQAEIEGGKPVVWTQKQGFSNLIGTRWPHGLAAKVGAHFNDIYGAAVKAGEVEI